jgi:ABC-type transport system involved in multi-copper enzyme maturation permease subunit
MWKTRLSIMHNRQFLYRTWPFYIFLAKIHLFMEILVFTTQKRLTNNKSEILGPQFESKEFFFLKVKVVVNREK